MITTLVILIISITGLLEKVPCDGYTIFIMTIGVVVMVNHAETMNNIVFSVLLRTLDIALFFLNE